MFPDKEGKHGSASKYSRIDQNQRRDRMPGYIIYVDALILRLAANFFFEFILLWAAAEATRSHTTRLRLALGASVGTLHHLLFLLSSYRLIPFYGLLRFFPTLLVVSVIMVLVTFYPVSKGKLLRILAYFYGIGFLSAGAGMAAAYLFGTEANPQSTVGVLVSIAVTLIIAELGWGIVQRRVYQRFYQLPITAVFSGREVCLNALIDTGNHLKDPLTAQPVIVVEQNAILPLFDPQTAAFIQELCSGNLDAVSDYTDASIAVRLRMIPFQAIGVQSGVLVAFKPDQIMIRQHKEELPVADALIAIYQHQLDPRGEYQALLPPELLERPAAPAAAAKSILGGETSHAAQSERKA